MYKCLNSEFPTLEKRLKTIIKKLEKNNLRYEFCVLPDSVEKIPVYKTFHDFQTATTVKTGDFITDVKNYIFWMEPLKLGDFTPMAVLDHTADGEQNFVYTLSGDTKVNPAWTIAPCRCEHCGHDRKRNKTVILLDKNGIEKQVGTSCIREYTGIDGLEVLGAYAELQAIVDEPLKISQENIGSHSDYTTTKTFLAFCIDEIISRGYEKIKTLERVIKAHGTSENPSKKAIIEAEKVIKFFSSITTFAEAEKVFGSNTPFYWNISTAISGEYCKKNGFVAYAYVAYSKAIEAQEKARAIEAKKALSCHTFSEGEKITLEVTYLRSSSYEASFNGYHNTIQYIHLFKDENENIFKWSTAKYLEKATGEKMTIKGTVKRHSEYRGEKQTEITRCTIK